jgi:mannose-binding lectin 1
MKVSVAVLAALVAGIVAQDVPDVYLSIARPFSNPPPEWEVQGSTTFENDVIRITSPDKGSQHGSLWSKYRNPFDEWTIETKISVSGPSGSGGGLAIWYASQSNEPGPIHGSRDYWDGLALMLDSLGWDDKAPAEDRGALRGHLNDGTFSLQSSGHASHNAFSLCRLGYRNSGQFTVRVGYGKGSLIVEVNGQKCFETKRVVLPKDYFFGVSAASTDQPDSFSLYQLDIYPKLLPSMEAHIEGHTAATAAAAAASAPTQSSAHPPAGQLERGPQGQVGVDSAKEEILRHLALSNERLKNAELLQNNIRSQLVNTEARVERLESMLKEFMNVQDRVLQNKYSDHQEHLSSEMSKLHAKLESINAVVNDHTSNILGSFSDTLNTAIDKGGYSIWVLFVMVIAIQGIMFVGYNVYRTRRSYHAKIL